MIKSALPLSLILICFAFFSRAQDRIITIQYDTLDCKINKITSSTIFFTVHASSFVTKGKIKKDQVLNYQSGPTQQLSKPSVQEKFKPTGNVPELEKGPIATEKTNRFRFGLSGGLNYLTASSAEAEKTLIGEGANKETVKDYYNSLKLGQSGGADLHYMISKTYGIGLIYKLYTTKSSKETFFNSPDGVNAIYGDMKERIFVNYAGLSFYSEQFLKANAKFKWNSHYSAGMAFYRDEATLINSPLLLTGKAFATNIDFGLEYFILPKISAGVNVSYFLSSIKKITYNNGITTTTENLEKDNYENISRLDLSVGIHIYR